MAKATKKRKTAQESQPEQQPTDDAVMEDATEAHPVKESEEENGQHSEASDREREDMLLMIAPDDIPFEEECLRNPLNIKAWLRYLEFKGDSSVKNKIFIYERAVNEAPGSYKLWKLYLDLRLSLVLEAPIKPSSLNLTTPKIPYTDPEWASINSCFERCLVLCHKYPVIWILHCYVLMHQPRPTHTRHVFDRALRALPITQHDRIWPLYLKHASIVQGEAAIRIWRRYLKLEPGEAEDYIDVLLDVVQPPRYAEAARVLASLVEDPKYKSKNGRSQYQFWVQLCELVCDHAEAMEVATADNPLPKRLGAFISGTVTKLDIDKILRSGISRFTDQVGKLWNALARWWILKGEIEKARDVYEEALSKIMTVADFSMIYQAYAEFEEYLVSNDIEEADDLEAEIRLARLERLVRRRPFLVNDVLLRQNPHNVNEWKNRVKLCIDLNNDNKVVETYTNAFDAISPKKASGKLSQLWIDFALWYARHTTVDGDGDEALVEDADAARAIFTKSTKVPYKRVEELADVWVAWSDWELETGHPEAALEVLGRATSPPAKTSASHQASIRYSDDNLPPQQRLFKSLKLWEHFVDLEEALGTQESTRAVYDRMIELKIATPQTIINYAVFLEEHNFFEESYRVYERGIALFNYPIAFEIWNLYLDKFIKRYAGTKLERARDLFEQAVAHVPANLAKALYIAYAKLEEDYGLARHAMRIYSRATSAVSDTDRKSMFELYIAKATSYFGLTSTREIYEKAIEVLPDKEARDMALRFCDLEVKLGEIDRGRAVLAFASQFCDPRMDAEFWKRWHDFEVKHGNEDTFKEMLRIKRSVQAKYNTDISFISAQLLAAKKAANPDDETVAAIKNGNVSAMQELEEEAEAIAAESAKPGGSNLRVLGFVSAKKTSGLAGSNTTNNNNGAVVNEEEIAIEDDDDDEEGGGDGDEGGENEEIEGITKAHVPEALFGNLLAASASNEKEEEVVGAMERLKRKR
ncbi:hypothetical protein SmJEL517_g02635 [Synchytrium microbalum]|uniref:Pre-mRNA-splicing factor SYF1 n=1 Tax=Synchytrium microbalum TaxID=1806994 RepID=A0A507C5A7_9FUNG|nr:uncharacterized protein SmJEL517_g02635 [Synchytrium microbalum]TPX34862.1 hypothetical protein SmJEL517_g02635 [Synchytrium microbalum]